MFIIPFHKFGHKITITQGIIFAAPGFSYNTLGQVLLVLTNDSDFLNTYF